MNQVNDFDKLFKERSDQMDFEFKDAYWTEMETLLDRKKKKRRALFWWLSGSSVSAVLLGLVMTYATSLDKSNSISLIKSVNQTSENLERNSDYIKRKSLNTINDSKKIAQEGLMKNNKKLQKSKSDLFNHSKPSSSFSGNSLKISKQPKIQEHYHDDLKATSEQDQDINSSQSANSMPLNIELLDEVSLEPLFMLYCNDLDQKQQKLAVFTNQKLDKRTWESHTGIILGTNHGQSFDTQEGKVGGMGAQCGLRFYFAHEKGFQLSTGLSFGINAIKGLKFEEKRKIYGFTEYNLVNTIYYNSMLTAHVPIYLGYQGEKIGVSGGLRLNYIMNTRGKVHTWDNSIIEQNIWGFAHGIKFFNLACGFESTYRIARHWDLGLSFDFDLSSRSEENNDLVSPEAKLWQSGLFIKYRIN